MNRPSSRRAAGRAGRAAGPVEFEFRYGWDWTSLILAILLFGTLAVGSAGGALLSFRSARLEAETRGRAVRVGPGGVQYPVSRHGEISLYKLTFACAAGALCFVLLLVPLVRGAYRRLRYSDRIAFTATALLLPAGKGGREVVVPYTSIADVSLKCLTNRDGETTPVAIVVSFKGREFEIELSKLPPGVDYREILNFLVRRTDLPKVVPDAPRPAPPGSGGEPAAPRYLVVGLPVGSGQLKKVVGAFDDPERARECVQFLRAGGKYHWLEVEDSAQSRGAGGTARGVGRSKDLSRGNEDDEPDDQRT